MDFSEDELLDAVERLVAGMLERAGIAKPPVDALIIAEEHLGIPVEIVEPAEEDDSGRRRPRLRQPSAGIALTPDMSPEQQQKVAATGIAHALMPEVLRKLGVPNGTESKQLAVHVRGLIVPRLLVPTKSFRTALRDCKNDLIALKAVFATATEEMIALRFLDLEESCLIAIVDDNVVAVRRSNRTQASRKLTPAEQECLDRAMEFDRPQRVRLHEWTVFGWPVPNRPFRRIILRAVPDDV